ncbi:MAG: CbiX/SirB N-terminal domain-containing protein [Cyanobacteria bacterium P01_C01_bin.120]
MRTAYLLVSHGSADPRHQAGLTRLAQGMRQHLKRRSQQAKMTNASALSHRQQSSSLLQSPLLSLPQVAPLPFRSQSSASEAASSQFLVGTATLEAATTSLAEQIIAFGQEALQQGAEQVVILPMFLLAGIHVKEDLPAEMAVAQAQLPASLQLTCLPYLGSHGPFKQYVAARLAKTKADRCVLLAHGSSRAAGNRGIQQLGKLLDTDVAFWSVAPDLETQVYNLMQQGHQHIAIAPFFLFPGSITDAITRRTEQLAEHLPKLSLRLLSPLGTSSELSKVIVEMVWGMPQASSVHRWQAPAQRVAKNSITA